MGAPRAALSAALVAMAGLAILSGATDPPRITPAEAPRWEGQAVRVEGIAQEPRASAAGGSFRVAAAGAGIQVRIAAGGVPAPGEWVEVMGRIGRLGGQLVLFAQDVEHGSVSKE